MSALAKASDKSLTDGRRGGRPRPSRWTAPWTASILAERDHPALPFIEFLARSRDWRCRVSSSMVMNTTPFAEPGICRTSTRPAGLEPAPVASLHGVGASDDALAVQVAAQKTDRMIRNVSPT